VAERGIDVLSLVVGLVAATVAVLVLVDRSGAVAVDGAVATAAVLVVLGLAGLARSLQRLLSGRRPPG
jgi:hypothetical protein